MPPAGTSQTSVYGALTTTVADSARHLDVVSGPDDRDRLSLPAPLLSYEAAIESFDVRGLRAAWSLDLGFAVEASEQAVARELDLQLEAFAAHGAREHGRVRPLVRLDAV